MSREEARGPAEPHPQDAVSGEEAREREELLRSLPRELPPQDLPALEDPFFPGERNIYAASPLRDVCGTRINPDAWEWYRNRGELASEDAAVRSCVDPNLEMWLGDVGSFDPRARVSQPPMEEWPLTTVLPRIVATGPGMRFELPAMSYVVDFGDVHSSPNTLPDPESFKRLIPRYAPEGSQLLANFMTQRAMQMQLWVAPEFWQHPVLDQFTAIMVPDFSVFLDDPKPQLLLGERMRQIFAEEGSAAGRTVIPSILWSREEQLGRQVELWASLYPRVHTIAFDAAAGSPDVDRTAWAWRHLLAIEKYLKGLDHIRWLFSGLTRGWHIRELNRIFPRRNYGIILSKSDYIAATRGTSDREAQARAFRRRVRQIADFHAGRVVADPVSRPDRWPKTAPEVRAKRKR